MNSNSQSRDFLNFLKIEEASKIKMEEQDKKGERSKGDGRSSVNREFEKDLIQYMGNNRKTHVKYVFV